MDTNREISDNLKLLKLPGYIGNFKGKFYNSDDLSGVLGQYQSIETWSANQSVISSKDEESSRLDRTSIIDENSFYDPSLKEPDAKFKDIVKDFCLRREEIQTRNDTETIQKTNVA